MPSTWRLPTHCVRLAAACGLVVSSLMMGQAEGSTPRLLLLGIDGCRYDAVVASRAPNLAQLAAEGAYADNTKILAPRPTLSDTVSGPGWSSILTGVWADKHQVNDNKFSRPRFGEFPHFFARVKAYQREARTVSIVDWPAIAQHIVSHADLSRSFGDDKEYYEPDRQVTAAVIEELTHQNPVALFVYLGQVDHFGHKHGFHPAVTEYTDAIRRVDAHLGQILEALRSRASAGEEDWLILVTSDHGGQGTGHGDGHQVPEIVNSFMIVSGAAAARGRIQEQTYLVDVPVTGLVHLGVPIDPAWQLDGQPRGLALPSAASSK